eukprot:TRINITY_DN717_c0_g1_i2.p1 TRINITY_DN717_c0_g1~~TRINITY_DN717_c0_g1_i2.p1  ORF type:complete len:123 (+),score=26.21 TRINITY_DN717_c0_g1_i2:59-427(+)
MEELREVKHHAELVKKVYKEYTKNSSSDYITSVVEPQLETFLTVSSEKHLVQQPEYLDVITDDEFMKIGLQGLPNIPDLPIHFIVSFVHLFSLIEGLEEKVGAMGGIKAIVYAVQDLSLIHI